MEKNSRRWYTKDKVEEGVPKSPWKSAGEDHNEKTMRQPLRQSFRGRHRGRREVLAEQPAGEKARGLKQHGTVRKISVVQND